MIVKNILAFLVACCLSAPLWAAGKVTLLDIQGDIVYFKTNQVKSGALPACVASDNTELWSLSLTHQSGRAIYALLITAMTSNLFLEVTSTADCSVVDGTEAAASVRFDNSGQTAGAVSLSGAVIYAGDGVTRVGSLVKALEKDKWLYVDTESASTLKELDNSFNHIDDKALRFSGLNCSGDILINRNDVSNLEGRVFQFKNVLSGKWLLRDENTNWADTISYEYNGECRNDNRSSTATFYKAVVYQHPKCGEYPCKIKFE